ncbi:NAD(P)-binding protein [Pyrenochaeta sp. DS3sAY3a]|nr:NAD(P)-binding protein [Pyrenochaeta sp. DS3sAY3a]
MSSNNLALIFNKVPTGVPEPGKHILVKDIGFNHDQELAEGSVILRILYSSLDHYLGALLRTPDPDQDPNDITAAVPLGNAIVAFALAEVLRSSRSDYVRGDIVLGNFPIQQYCSSTLENQPNLQKVDHTKGPKDIRHYLGAMGMPGLVAYSSLHEIGKPKAGEVLFVSSAGGAVGQLVAQLAKQTGLRVIGSVGSDEKLKFLIGDLGIEGFNYKTEKAADALRRLAPEGIDIYYDNVGGEQLEAAIDVINSHGRIIACGQISQYHLAPEERYPLRNTMYLIGKQVTWRGFMVGDPAMGLKWKARFHEHMSKLLDDGIVISKMDEQTGMNEAAQALVRMLKGHTFGKAILRVKE